MDLKVWIVMAALSLAGAGVWYMFYCLSARARKRIAEKKGQKPKLAFVRIVYLSTGIIGQIFFWNMVKALSEWDGMR